MRSPEYLSTHPVINVGELLKNLYTGTTNQLIFLRNNEWNHYKRDFFVWREQKLEETTKGKLELTPEQLAEEYPRMLETFLDQPKWGRAYGHLTKVGKQAGNFISIAMDIQAGVDYMNTSYGAAFRVCDFIANSTLDEALPTGLAVNQLKDLVQLKYSKEMVEVLFGGADPYFRLTSNTDELRHILSIKN